MYVTPGTATPFVALHTAHHTLTLIVCGMRLRVQPEWHDGNGTLNMVLSRAIPLPVCSCRPVERRGDLR
jgi:hypothetical protein